MFKLHNNCFMFFDVVNRVASLYLKMFILEKNVGVIKSKNSPLLVSQKIKLVPHSPSTRRIQMTPQTHVK